jgi:hypothetical protein
MPEKSISQRLREFLSDRPAADAAKPMHYVVQTENLFGKPISKPLNVRPSHHSVVIFSYPKMLTSETVQLESDGTLVRINTYNGEIIRTRAISSVRRAYLDGIKPRFQVVRPA